MSTYVCICSIFIFMYTAYFPMTPNHNGRVAGAGCPHCDSAARCTAQAHNVRRMTFFQFLFCSPASALCCPGRITSLHNLPPAWHGRTSSKNFHLIAAKNGKNKLKEKENNKIKICRWLLFTILLRLCHERRWGMSTATDSDVDCDCDACYALCGYVMRGPPSPQMAFQLPLHALPCLELDRHMHLPQHPLPPFISTGKHTPKQKRTQRRIAVETQ